MKYEITHIRDLLEAEQLNNEVITSDLSQVAFDSRKVNLGNITLFFALQGQKSDGHDFIKSAYEKGVRNFIISKSIDVANFPLCNFLKVSSTLSALQTLAKSYRRSLDFPIIGITGSNGKTIVKEWLYTALSLKHKVSKTPLSYNSQIGVPYSILHLDSDSDIALLEAGISAKGEMQKLYDMIHPEVGIFTNLGDAHQSGFQSKSEKLNEKLDLFKDSAFIIINYDDDEALKETRKRYPYKLFTWGKSNKADLQWDLDNSQNLNLNYGVASYSLLLKKTAPHQIDNLMPVLSYLIRDGWSEEELQRSIELFSSVPNRLELRNGHNDNLILNDTYSCDIASLRLAFSQLVRHADERNKVVIITEMDQQNGRAEFSKVLNKLCRQEKVNQLITIGMDDDFDNAHGRKNYPSIEALLNEFDLNKLSDSVILLKASSSYDMRPIIDRLAAQVHQTVLETNLSAVSRNLNAYRSLLKPETMIMAVIKASAYGSGSHQVARFLEREGVDYLGVALVDEAITLRKQGCKIPIMIFNVQQKNLDSLWDYDLEPEVYGFELLEALIKASQARQKRISIHLKIDTGMRRLGFLPDEIDRLISLIKSSPQLQVKSIFSHLSSSENAADDSHTMAQIRGFDQCYEKLVKHLNPRPFRHILNTAGVVRHTTHQYELVRIGLGLYGMDDTAEMLDRLQLAHTLTARIIQIKTLEAGQSTGYGMAGKNDKEVRIAIISLGYADGLMRAAGMGNYAVLIDNQPCKTIGTICMDVTMVILPEGSEAQVGDKVTIFGPDYNITALATACNTISYEIISRIAPRVKRTYILE